MMCRSWQPTADRQEAVATRVPDPRRVAGGGNATVTRLVCYACLRRDTRILKEMIDSARSSAARRGAAMLRRYQRYEALRPFTCPEGADHYLLEPYAVAGDVLLVCPTCGFADVVEQDELPELSVRLARAAAFWRGIPG